MKLQAYVFLWLLIAVVMGVEYWTINHNVKISFLNSFRYLFPSFFDFKLTTEAGRTLSYFLGWTGFGLILMTNPYIVRKKWSVLKKIGTLPGWLNFHIFCGLLGPTCIIFHSDFKVRGLVGISFWSMIIVAASGIVGRYIYIQVLIHERDAGVSANKLSAQLDRMLEKTRPSTEITSSNHNPKQILIEAKKTACEFVGLPKELTNASLLQVLSGSLRGDIRLLYSAPHAITGLPENSRYVLAEYALAQRRIVFLEPFKKMLGYWHSFHLPFAFFMYLAALIHICAALMFGI